jgi:hypothetical protein
MKKKYLTSFVIVLMTLVISSSFVGGLNVNSPTEGLMTTTSDGTGTFILDFNTEEGRNGGYLEGDEIDGWTIHKRITNDDFDNTDDYINWTSEDGIYSAIRTDEDLDDDDSDEGAWCVGAGEQGSVGWDEDSRGYTWLVSPAMTIADYVDETLPQFEITQATFTCKYQFSSRDFDNTGDYQYVMFNTYIKNEQGTYGFFNFPKTSQHSPETINTVIGEDLYPGDGKCVRFWDPGDPNEPWCYCHGTNWKTDTYTYSTSQMHGGGLLADWLSDTINNKIYLVFHLDIRLIGGLGGNAEFFKFWLDDVSIECEYEYYYENQGPNNPTISHSPSRPKPRTDVSVTVSATHPNAVDDRDYNPSQVKYKLDWNTEQLGETGWMPSNKWAESGESYTFKDNPGFQLHDKTYTIKVKVKDKDGDETSWIEHDIRTKADGHSRIVDMPVLQNLMKHFTFLEQLLSRLL